MLPGFFEELVGMGKSEIAGAVDAVAGGTAARHLQRHGVMFDTDDFVPMKMTKSMCPVCFLAAARQHIAGGLQPMGCTSENGGALW
jgi:hypothetical protein